MSIANLIPDQEVDAEASAREELNDLLGEREGDNAVCPRQRESRIAELQRELGVID